MVHFLDLSIASSGHGLGSRPRLDSARQACQLGCQTENRYLRDSSGTVVPGSVATLRAHCRNETGKSQENLMTCPLLMAGRFVSGVDIKHFFFVRLFVLIV